MAEDATAEVGGSSRYAWLDNVEEEHIGALDDQDESGHNRVDALLHSKDVNLQDLLSLTLVERLKWKLGMRLPMPALSKRLFDVLDFDHTGLLQAESLDSVLNFLSHYFPVGKATSDIVQVLCTSSWQQHCRTVGYCWLFNPAYHDRIFNLAETLACERLFHPVGGPHTSDPATCDCGQSMTVQLKKFSLWLSPWSLPKALIECCQYAGYDS